MEDGINDVSKAIAEETGMDVYAGFRFDLASGLSAYTKASSVTDEGKDTDYSESQTNELKVAECFVVVASGDDILGSHMYESSEITGSGAEYTLSTHITVKVPTSKPALTVFAIGYYKDSYGGQCWDGNMKKAVSVSSFTSLSALKKSVLGKNVAGGTIGNSLSDFIKTGELTGITDYFTSTKMADFHNTTNCKAVEIPLTLRAAGIELMSFSFYSASDAQDPIVALSTTRAGGKSTTKNNGSDISAKAIRAYVTDIVIDKQVINTVLSPDQTELSDKVTEETSFSKAYNAKLDNATGEEKEEIENSSHPLNHRFYSYQNTSEDTHVTIKYKVNNVPGECSFVIGGTGSANRIKAGHLYQLHVKITNGSAKATCTVNDFIPNTITGEWEEVTTN